MRRLSASALAVCVFLSSANAGTTLRVMEIGNSLTHDAWDGNGLASYAAARENTLVQGRSICWGRGIKTQWDDYAAQTQNAATTYTNMGFFQTALADHTWDAITFQPFSNSLADEMTAARRIVELADAREENRNAALFLYAPWPGCEYVSDDPTFDTKWVQPYEGGEVGNFSTKDYFRQCYAKLVADFPARKVYYIPTGEVFADLAQRMTAGEVPGLDDPRSLYRDGLHASMQVGRYAASVSYYAGLTHEDPRGLPVPSDYAPDVTPEVARAIQDSIWYVFTSQAASTGLWAPGDVNGDGAVNFDDLLALAQHYEAPPPEGGGEAVTSAARRCDGDLTGDGHVNFDDLLTIAQHYGETNVPVGIVPPPTTLPTGLRSLDSSLAADWALAQSIVPEPAMGVLAVGATAALQRRRR